MNSRMKKGLAVVGLVILPLALLLAPVSLGAQPETTTVRIDPASQDVGPGATFTVDVMIDDVVDLGAFEFSIGFDPAVVNVDSVAIGPFLGSTGRTVVELPVDIDNVNGILSYGAFTFGDFAGPDGSGLLATVTLHALDLDEQAASVLDLYDTQVTDTAGVPITPITEADGNVTVLTYAVDLSGDTYGFGFAPGDTVSHSFTVTNSGGISDTFTIAVSGNSWASTPSAVSTGLLEPNQSFAFQVDVQIPVTEGVVDSDTFEVTVTSDTMPAVTDSATGTTEWVECDATFLIDPPLVEARSTEGNFSVDVVISDVVNFGGYDAELHFDPAVVHVEGVVLGSFPGSTGNMCSLLGPDIDNVTGVASFGVFCAGDYPGPDGSGIVTTVTLSPQTDDGETALDLQEIQATDMEGILYEIVCHADGYVIVTPCYWADFDCDCDVDVLDIMMAVVHWGCAAGDECYDPSFDFNDDGVINILDLQPVANEWGWTCPE